MNIGSFILETLGITALIVGFTISIRSIYGYFAGIKYLDFDRALALIFLVILYISLLLELVVFFTSTFTYEESFKAMEQLALFIVAVASAQTGRMISSKSGDDTVKFRFRSVFYSITTGLLIYSIFI